jgi:cell division transport system permease protein
VRAVAGRIRIYDFVEDIRYGEDWVSKLYRLRNIAAAAALALGTTFALVAIVIIASTIRLIVLARAKEITIMRLVGATDSFVRRPFLIEGFITGVLGGLIALLMLAGADRAINAYFVQSIFFQPWMAAAGIAGGAFIGLIGSGFAVGRHLRTV